jgi:hypothetical protein
MRVSAAPIPPNPALVTLQALAIHSASTLKAVQQARTTSRCDAIVCVYKRAERTRAAMGEQRGNLGIETKGSFAFFKAT